MIDAQDNKQLGKLLVVFELFSSFAQLEKEGQLFRTLCEYEKYSEYFEKVFIKTPENKRFINLPSNIEHIPFPAIPFGKYFYFLFSGLLNYKHVDYLEVDDVRAIVSVLIYKLTGAKIFLHHRWSSSKLLKGERPLFAFLTRIVEILAFKMADTVAVTTERLGEDVKKHTRKDKIYLLPNHVDVEHFKPIKSEKIQNLMVFVGRLHPEKNLCMLLEVMKELPEFKLWIIGDGELREELMEIKRREEIKNVEFLGLIPNEELPKYLNKAEAFIMVSHREGHPKALIEAMACELPCIGTNVDGIKDVIIDGETGLLCDKNAEDIKRCIMKLFSNREKMREMGRKAREFAVENYSMSKIIERKVKLIKGELDGIEPLYKD